MASKTDIKKKLKEWKSWCDTVQSSTPVDIAETPSQRKDRVRSLLLNSAEFRRYYFPHYCSSPSAKFHLKWNKAILRNPNLVAIIVAFRESAKSTSLGLLDPLQLLAAQITEYQSSIKGMRFMLTIGKSGDAAKDHLSNLQAELEFNQRFINDFGKQKSLVGSWEEGEFETASGCAFTARGRGQSPRGLRFKEQRPDYVFVTDLDDDELSKNPDRVNKMTDWVIGALYPAMSILGGRFVMEGNAPFKHMVLRQVLERMQDLKKSQKNRDTQIKTFHDQVDIVDKKGKPTWPERHSPAMIEDKRAFVGYRIFEREYKNNPIESGTVFRSEWIQWSHLGKLGFDHHIIYIDPSFKKSTSSDYKAVKHWAKKGIKLYHIKAFVRQCSVSAMVKWCYDYYESLSEVVRASVIFMMEANFLQDIILDDFEEEGKTRGYMLPIMPDKRKKPDKFQRIEAISPLWERGLVYYSAPEKENADMKTGLEQLLGFEKGSRAHDDGPDADEGAIYLLQKRGRTRLEKATIGKRVHINNW